jgi:hypothetical protein
VNVRVVPLLALAALVATDREPLAADDASRVVAFRVEGWPGENTAKLDGSESAMKLKKVAAEILAKRCAHAGLDGVTAAVGGIGVEAKLPPALAGREGDVRRLAARRGCIEFRVRAETGFEDEWKERKLEGVTTPPKGFEWAEDEQSGRATLLETPEADAFAKIQALVGQDDGKDHADEWRATKAAFEKVRASSVFDNADVAEATVERSISTYGAATHLRVAIRFTLKDARRAAFEKFTGDHVGRALAIVIDGKVHLCLPIAAAIPGEAKWIGPGTGYTDESAQEIAALLACGPLPCRLVAAETK